MTRFCRLMERMCEAPYSRGNWRQRRHETEFGLSESLKPPRRAKKLLILLLIQFI
jgi:hypothetical protein